MDNKKSDKCEFSAFLKDVKPLKPSKHIEISKKKKLDYTKLELSKQRLRQSNMDYAQQSASIQLSDDFQAHWPENKPIHYVSEYVNNPHKSREYKDVIKRLKMGLIPPDLVLDMHGLTVKQAKQEIIAVIHDAKKHSYQCINIIHGHGNGILKKKTPDYLYQHPDVVAFIQSPKEYGGNAGLLVLVTDDFTRIKN